MSKHRQIGARYSPVRINDCNGDLSKRWYVYYQYRHPVTGNFQDFKVYKGINRIKTVTGRRKQLRLLKLAMEKLLQEGFSPFEKFEFQSEKEIVYSASDAMRYVLKHKREVLGDTSYKPLASRINKFNAWLKKEQLHETPATELKRAHISDFLLQLKLSPRSRNNYLSDIQTAFEFLVENEKLENNPAHYLKKVASKSRMNKPFTTTQIEKIKEHLQEVDPQLYLFIRVVAFEFLRPKEVANLKVKHIDLQNRQIRVDTKSKVDKVKIIVNALLPDLQAMDLDSLPGDYNLFTPEGKPAMYEAAPDHKRDYFTEAFSKKVKKHFDFAREYGIYSFRHTFAVELYRNFIKQGMTTQEAKYKMLPITGHQSLGALENYLRDIGAELPDDYSSNLPDF